MLPPELLAECQRERTRGREWVWGSNGRNGGKLLFSLFAARLSRYTSCLGLVTRGAIGQFLEFRVGTVTERRRVERVHEEKEIRIHLT